MNEPITTPIQLPTIQNVSMQHGWYWVQRAFYLFKAYPVMWVIFFIIYFAIMVPISNVPIIGSVVSSLLAPVFAAGMMLGCRAISQQQELEINHLFAGFKQNTAQLVTLGGLYMLGILIAAMLFMSAADPTTMDTIRERGELSPEAISGLMTPLLLAMLVLMPVLMAYWFAPALVALNNLPAMDALKLSLKACMSNMLAFLVYGLIFTAITFALMFLVGILGKLGIVLIVFAFMVILPLMMISIFTSYQDIFK